MYESICKQVSDKEVKDLAKRRPSEDMVSPQSDKSFIEDASLPVSSCKSELYVVPISSRGLLLS